MAKIKVYNLKGGKVKEIELVPEIFEVEFRPDLINEVILSLRANRRYSYAHTKTRAEVKGGGKKPWSQKGTGRARHGSIRSPLWVGGGVTFGPRKEKDYTKKINTKTKRLALFSALSKKLKDNEIKIIDKFDLKEIKTKKAFEILKSLYKKDKKDKKLDLLVVLPKKNEIVRKSLQNLIKTKIILADSLNVEDLMIYRNILIEEPSIEVIKKTYLNK